MFDTDAEIYTVINTNGENLGNNLRAYEAVDLVLTHDSQEWCIRDEWQEGDEFHYVWTRKECAGKPWTRMTSIWSGLESKPDNGIAVWNDILEKVIKASQNWTGSPYVILTSVWRDMESESAMDEYFTD